MAQVLELAQLAHGDGVAHVQVGLGRVVAAVDAQRPAFALRLHQPPAQLGSHLALGFFVAIAGALHQDGDLFVDGHLAWVGGRGHEDSPGLS